MGDDETAGGSPSDAITSVRAWWPNQEAQIRYLRSIVESSRALPEIRRLARDIVFRVFDRQQRDRRAHAIALARWVQTTIIYVNEMPEVFQTPVTTLAEGYGDCDDQAVLLAALLEAVGIPAYLIAIGWSVGPDAPDYEHIYAAAELPDGQGGTLTLPLDTTLRTDIRKSQRDPFQEMKAAGRSPRIFVA